ncbi:MAG: TRAP transporter substrate-binding protein [Deltaproteobacteria bacterium]|nr:TRAP transporter substrate-binding protein [Deltaproteobacteria bacterium]
MSVYLQKISICKLLLFFAILLFQVTIFPCLVEARERLTFAKYFPPNHPWAKGSITLADQVSEKSGNALKIEFLPKGSFKNPAKVIAGLRAGNIDIAVLRADVLGSFEKPYQIFNLPFMFHDLDHADDILAGYIGKKLLKETENKDFIAVSFLPSDFPMIANTIRPIKTINDLKGMKIVSTSKIPKMGVLKLLGTVPVEIGRDELYSAMASGVVDGIESNSRCLYETKAYKASKYVTELPLYYFPGVLLFNANRWHRMSKTYQNIIVDSISTASEVIRKSFSSQKIRFNKTLEEYHVKFNSIQDTEPFKKAIKPVYKDGVLVASKKWSNIAYTLAHNTFDLDVRSNPQGADIDYASKNKQLKRYKDPTNCVLPELYYATWIIKATLSGETKEQEFDPFREKNKVIIFDFE